MMPPVISLFLRARRVRPGVVLLVLLFFIGGATMPAQTAETWSSTDIGAVGPAGNSSESGNVVTIRGAGADIWGAADGFHFRSQTLAGDGLILARVTATGGGHAWAKVGLMMREDLTPGARNVMALLSSGGSLGLQVRADPDGPTAYTEHMRAPAPVWLVLDRVGNEFRAHRSLDGITWTTIGTVTLDLPVTIHTGVAVTSHSTALLQEATLDDVMLIPDDASPDNPPAPPANFQVFAPHAGAIQLEWMDGNETESGFEIERAEAGGAFAVLTTVVYNSTVYVDYPPDPFVVYQYRLRTVRDGVYSAYTPVGSSQAGEWPLPSGWFGADVGNTGSPGSDTGYRGDGSPLTMNAGGSDIYGDADGFRYVTRTSEGDHTITARVASLGNTHPWAKAGVMFRASGSPGAVNVAMLLTPANGAIFQVRRYANHLTSGVGIRAFSAPNWVRLTRSGNTFTGYVSVDGEAWTKVGSTTITLPSQLYVGMAATAHASVQTVATFDHIEDSLGAPPSSGWTRQDLGSGRGDATFSSTETSLLGRIQVTSGDIYENNDSGVFYHRAWTGDGAFVAQTGELTRTHDWAKAGIMVRAGVGPSDANVFIAVTPTQGTVFQSRTDHGWNPTGWNTETHARNWTAGPGSWLKLVRSGGSIAASWSSDGTTWHVLASIPDTLPAVVRVGLAASSHNPTAMATADFVSFTQE